MAWVSRSDRFNASGKSTSVPDTLGPGAYGGHIAYEVEPSYAPFGSSKVLASASKSVDDRQKESGPPPGAYDPKLPKAYDSGLPAKKAPFGVGGAQREELKVKGVQPGPGQYAVAGKAPEKLPCRTMGVPQSEQRSIFRSTSAPSIPRDHQCNGYEEAGDGRLVRQGRRDGGLWLSGRPDDCCGPGQYDFKVDLTKPRVAQGKFLGGPARSNDRPATEVPGPGHYVAKAPVKQLPMYSSFACEVGQTSTKIQKTRSQGPGPGAYSLDQKSSRPDLRELQPELQYFGSTVERFKEDKRHRGPDPGAYTDPSRQQRAPKPSFGTCGRFQGADMIVATEVPGPGSYRPPGELASGIGATASILGSTGNLAFGSMESKRGFAPSKMQAPDPGTYKTLTSFPEEESMASAGPRGEKVQRRLPKKPMAAFKSETPKDVMTLSFVKEGQQRPPPGAYDPIHQQDAGAVMRLPPRHEGFLSAGPQRPDGPESKNVTAPGPGRYDRQDVTGGKRAGSFNRTVSEGVPAKGRPRGLGFSSQDMRFKAKSSAKSTPGPGAYSTDPGWNTRTYNVHFGDLY